MSETKHTPGPWLVKKEHFTLWIWADYDGAGQRLIAHVNVGEKNLINGDTIEQREVDTNLMAAAPELLASCKEFVEFWERSNFNEDSDLYKYAKAAIKKATE